MQYGSTDISGRPNPDAVFARSIPVIQLLSSVFKTVLRIQNWSDPKLLAGSESGYGSGKIISDPDTKLIRSKTDKN
jgi:hypothetical protein